MGPSQYPQNTRAGFGPKAVGSSIHIRYTSPNVKPYGRVKSRTVAEPQIHGRNPHHAAVTRQFDDMDPDQETARADELATTDAASAPEPAAESPVETAEVEIADKAEELNIEVIMEEVPAALDPTERRLELWKQSTSRKLMIQVLPNRVCSIAADRTDHRVRERCFKSDSGEVSRSRRNLQCPGIQHHRRRAAAVPSSRAEKL